MIRIQISPNGDFRADLRLAKALQLPRRQFQQNQITGLHDFQQRQSRFTLHITGQMETLTG